MIDLCKAHKTFVLFNTDLLCCCTNYRTFTELQLKETISAIILCLRVNGKKCSSEVQKWMPDVHFCNILNARQLNGILYSTASHVLFRSYKPNVRYRSKYSVKRRRMVNFSQLTATAMNRDLEMELF